MSHKSGRWVWGKNLPKANYEDAIQNLPRIEVSKSLWEYDMADPQGLWESFTNSIHPVHSEFLDEVEKLKDKIRKSERIDPITVDGISAWPWIEGQHRLKAAIDLGIEKIPGFFRVK